MSARPRSLGILGGTFNPPHLGHVAVARHAREELALERVLLVPAGSPPHKPAGEDPGAEHRLRMCQLVVESVEGLTVCPLELERGGPSYTVDTLRAIHASHPDAELTFIVGADTATTLASWRDPVELLGLARLAVAARVGSGRERVLDTVSSLVGTDAARAGSPPRVDFLEMPLVEVSSSMVRERAALGQPLDGLVGAGVARYVAAHGLYRVGAGAVS
jgi:nicotinate-nucleotide adenylyltransferase